MKATSVDMRQEEGDPCPRHFGSFGRAFLLFGYGGDEFPEDFLVGGEPRFPIELASDLHAFCMIW